MIAENRFDRFGFSSPRAFQWWSQIAVALLVFPAINFLLAQTLTLLPAVHTSPHFLLSLLPLPHTPS